MSTLKKLDSPATYADIEALPETLVGEILFGTLYTHRMLPPRHGHAMHQLTVELMHAFDRRGTGAWLFLGKPELHLGSNIVVPDIGGWHTERLTPLPDVITAAPDWAAEIITPETQAIDRTDKLAIYAGFGVGHCWYVDPIARTLEVFALVGGKWLLAAAFKEDAEVCAPPFEAHTFKLDVLWV